MSIVWLLVFACTVSSPAGSGGGGEMFACECFAAHQLHSLRARPWTRFPTVATGHCRDCTHPSRSHKTPAFNINQTPTVIQQLARYIHYLPSTNNRQEPVNLLLQIQLQSVFYIYQPTVSAKVEAVGCLASLRRPCRQVADLRTARGAYPR